MQPEFARIEIASQREAKTVILQSTRRLVQKRAIWLRTLSRSSGSAIISGVSPTRLRRGTTGTPALWRRAIARRERPPPAIGIESKSCSEFRTREVPLPMFDPGANKTATMAPTSKYLAQSNKSLRRGQATRIGEALPAARHNFVRGPSWPTAQRYRL